MAGDVSGRRAVLDETFLAPPCVGPAPGDNGAMPNSESDLTMEHGVLRFKCDPKPVSWWVEGPVINSATEHREKLREWKVKLARAVKEERGGGWNPEHLYAVTLQFRFHPRPTKLDVDNYVKPVLDGLAAGLFLPDGTDPGEVERFDVHHGVDDSNFRILLIQRLLDAKSREEEEVRLFVSSTRHAHPG